MIFVFVFVFVFFFIVRIAGFLVNLSLDGNVGINPIAILVFAVLLASSWFLEL